MIKFLKPFRVVVSLTFLLFISFILIDFRNLMPDSFMNKILFLQFVPSFLKFLGITGLLSFGFIVVLILTLLFGRVYCSLICPLGIFQDVISFIAKKRKRKNVRFKYSKPYNVIRYALLALTIIPLFFGSIFVLSLLDPYSNFGRIASDFGKPFYNFLNNVTAEILIQFRIYSVSPIDITHISWFLLVFPAVILFTVLGFSYLRGRLYCNTICPVGTLLGLISKISLFQIIIDKHSCTQCAKCAFVCKSECIGIKEQTVDMSRCVGCFNCLKACDKSGIGFQFAYGPKKSDSKKVSPDVKKSAVTDSSKRDFLARSLFFAGAMVTLPKALQAENTDKKTSDLIPINRNHYCTPPGSVSFTHFTRSCTACHLCVTACPSKVLQPSFLEYGLAGILKPYMDNHTNYCQIDCTKCGEVCPTGAILPLTQEVKKTTQIGKVKFIKHNCIVFRNETSCGSCSEHCPTQAVSMETYKGMLTIPVVNEEICIGCGACEHACPVKPYKAIYVEANIVHQIAKKPVLEKVKNTSTEDFPF